VKIVVLGSFPREPDGPLAGGVETVMTVLLPELQAMPDMTVEVLTADPSIRTPETQRWKGMTIHRLPRRRMGHITFYQQDRRAMGRLLSVLSPDLVHAQGSGMYAGAAIESGYPAVITMHGVISREAALAPWNWHGLQQRMAGLYERRCLLARARHIIAISPYVQEACRNWSPAQMHGIENPIADRFFTDTETASTGRVGRVLFAGLIRPRKRVLDLLAAWKQVVAMRPNARLQIAGDDTIEPAYAAEVRERVQTWGLTESVQFLGALSSRELARYYRDCAFLVLPSAQETAPMVIEEVMAAGKPVVATRVGGVPCLVEHEQTGLLTGVGDTEELARAMNRLLADEPLRARMGREARRRAESRFRAAAVARRTRKVYDIVINDKPENPAK